VLDSETHTRTALRNDTLMEFIAAPRALRPNRRFLTGLRSLATYMSDRPIVALRKPCIKQPGALKDGPGRGVPD
jgi:hypothetical protein